jgi:hypothetical protein
MNIIKENLPLGPFKRQIIEVLDLLDLPQYVSGVEESKPTGDAAAGGTASPKRKF